MIEWIRSWFKKPCEHKNHWECRQYLLDDGTPMVRFECLDCHFIDHGHVHMGDTEGWCKTLYKSPKDIEPRSI